VKKRVAKRPLSRTLTLSPLLKHRYGRQRFALEKFEKCAAACGDIGNVVGYAIFIESSQRIAATGNTKRRTIGNSVRDTFGAGAELVDFKYTDRPVPDDRTGRFQQLAIGRCRLRSDIEDQLIGFDGIDGANLRRRRLTDLQ